MTKRFFILVILGLGFPCISTYAQGTQFEELSSWQQVKEKARRENKYIFVDVYATWCGPCKQMDRQVYPNEAVGKVLNDKFIAIKVQQDQTDKDDAYVKSWYADAKAISETYKVEALPSYLFFSPEGELVHRGLGFQDVPAFIAMVKTALTDPIARFHEQLEAYKQGHKDYTAMPELIKKVRDIGKDEQLARDMAKDYKEHYLDELSEDELCTRKHLDFIGEYFTLINSKDKFFKLCYEQPGKVDEVKDYKGWADFQVTQTINREEIDAYLWKGDQPLTRTPEWDKMHDVISKKYTKVDTRKMILDAQLSFYARIEDYINFVKYVENQMEAYPPKPGTGSRSDSWRLNVYAWILFVNSNDRDLLEKGLLWSDLAIKLDHEGCQLTGDAPNIQIYDTKANLLYKLGRLAEAIAWEKKAREQGIVNARRRGRDKGDYYDKYTAIINKMEKGEPTWPVK
ncbi:thioredoxin family protein [Chitinophaga japonensis]|uniref:Thioredoxin-like protein n=1 Tax=Chitinophaga japonensis TaxID=104662 RepID=A0A562SSZ9_CHIJA|nr:DUF255 domain-containing protein [Chitinophaga japonensis]TWI84375.1 thioredoxin-like protein [Chitinophaga japonensis]